MSYVWNTIASWNGYENAEKSRLMDERDLSRGTTYKNIEASKEKATKIYRKIIEQQDIKAKMADKKRFY